MTIEEKQTHYQALMIDKKVLDGIRYMGVVTTKIFCQPNCPARRPLIQNCQFFTSLDEATQAGFRACKRCRPTESPAWYT